MSDQVSDRDELAETVNSRLGSLYWLDDRLFSGQREAVVSAAVDAVLSSEWLRRRDATTREAALAPIREALFEGGQDEASRATKARLLVMGARLAAAAVSVDPEAQR